MFHWKLRKKDISFKLPKSSTHFPKTKIISFASGLVRLSVIYTSLHLLVERVGLWVCFYIVTASPHERFSKHRPEEAKTIHVCIILATFDPHKVYIAYACALHEC